MKASSSIATTNLYLHHLGTGADRAGLARLNEPGREAGHKGGTTGAQVRRWGGTTMMKPRPA
jgi:hypothetical protein